MLKKALMASEDANNVTVNVTVAPYVNSFDPPVRSSSLSMQIGVYTCQITFL